MTYSRGRKFCGGPLAQLKFDSRSQLSPSCAQGCVHMLSGITMVAPCLQALRSQSAGMALAQSVTYKHGCYYLPTGLLLLMSLYIPRTYEHTLAVEVHAGREAAACWRIVTGRTYRDDAGLRPASTAYHHRHRV